MAIDSNCNIEKLNNIFLESCVSFIELEIRHIPSRYNIKDLSISHTALIIICIRRVYIYNSFHEISNGYYWMLLYFTDDALDRIWDQKLFLVYSQTPDIPQNSKEKSCNVSIDNSSKWETGVCITFQIFVLCFHNNSALFFSKSASFLIIGINIWYTC